MVITRCWACVWDGCGLVFGVGWVFRLGLVLNSVLWLVLCLGCLMDLI